MRATLRRDQLFGSLRHSLCARHHRTGDDSYHKLGPRKFSEVHHLNILAIIARLNTKYGND